MRAPCRKVRSHAAGSNVRIQFKHPRTSLTPQHDTRQHTRDSPQPPPRWISPGRGAQPVPMVSVAGACFPSRGTLAEHGEATAMATAHRPLTACCTCAFIVRCALSSELRTCRSSWGRPLRHACRGRRCTCCRPRRSGRSASRPQLPHQLAELASTRPATHLCRDLLFYCDWREWCLHTGGALHPIDPSARRHTSPGSPHLQQSRIKHCCLLQGPGSCLVVYRLQTTVLQGACCASLKGFSPLCVLGR